MFNISSDLFSALLARARKGGGGSATLIEKSISANGVYNASDDSADGYSKVTVDVPNTYTAEDEGNVVNNGALVAQTTHAEITENGTYDITTNNSVSVNVSGGGDYNATFISMYTFDKNCLTKLNVPIGCTEIGDSAFQNFTRLKEVNIPVGVTRIGEMAFRSCIALTTITLPDGLKEIKYYCFGGCTYLTEIEIPSTVTTIGNYVFSSCTNLTNIIINKPQDSISGAPWGAPNATVVWTG